MESFKSIAKGGWHPDKKSSSSSSSRSSYSSSSKSGDNERFKNFKGLQQVANWTGHGSKGGSENATVARPLTSLKDPNEFGAPPKRDPKAPLPPPQHTSVLGEEQAARAAPQVPPREQEEQEPPRPRGFQINTTGINTSNLPAPPKRVLGTNSSSSPASPGTTTTSRAPPPLPGRAQPPPLPGRQPSSSVSSQEAPSVASYGTGPSTAAAAARLGKAGISVPGFDIGTTNTGQTSPPLPSRSKPAPPIRSSAQESSPTSTQPPSYSIGELSSRFGSLKSSSASTTSSTEPSSTGTTWAQKQAALKTASQLRNDPSTVSLSDAMSAAKTADSFRQRHGDQVVQGYRKAESMGVVDQVANASQSGSPKLPSVTKGKWGDITPRATKLASPLHSPSHIGSHDAAPESHSELASVAAKKKPPPPPKPKPKDLEGTSKPPPIPLGTKPK